MIMVVVVEVGWRRRLFIGAAVSSTEKTAGSPNRRAQSSVNNGATLDGYVDTRSSRRRKEP